MLTREEEVWMRVYCAYVAGRNGGLYNPELAKNRANKALEHFRDRFKKAPEANDARYYEHEAGYVHDVKAPDTAD